MNTLENIPKKNIFEVPEGYFDRLPSQIQSKITTKQVAFFEWKSAVKYALPILILGVACIFWYHSETNRNLNINEQLETVDEVQLSLYLDDSELTAEDLIETMTWDESDLKDLEGKVYDSFEVGIGELENTLNEF